MGRKQTRVASKMVIEIDLNQPTSAIDAIVAVGFYLNRVGMPRHVTRTAVAIEGVTVASVKLTEGAMKECIDPPDYSPTFSFTLDGMIKALWSDVDATLLKRYTVSVPEYIPTDKDAPADETGMWIYSFYVDLVIPVVDYPYFEKGKPCLRLSGQRMRPSKPSTAQLVGFADLHRMAKELVDLKHLVGQGLDNVEVANYFKDVERYAAPEAQERFGAQGRSGTTRTGFEAQGDINGPDDSASS